MSNLSGETAIVIPVYKQHPSRMEKLSLAKCLQILNDYPVYIISPTGLDLSQYLQENSEIKVECFEDEYFDGVDGYNKLLLSRHFYERFSDFEYMLIYQLDALVFKNTLEEWTGKDYDYVGAPWLKFPFIAFISICINVSLKPALKLLFQKKLSNPVGNGGLSLRKISSCITAIDENRKLLENWNANEDYFWSYFATVDGNPLRKPSKHEAARFSIETHPEEAFRMIGNILPFGVHDWENHDKAFWNNLLWKIDYFGNTPLLSGKPKISIITVAREADEISRTFNSLRKNKYSNMEFIVVNSSSDHRTLTLMKKNQDIIHKWAWGPDNIYESMNKGLSMATGEYIWFVKEGQKIFGDSVLNRIFKSKDLFDVYYGHSLLLNPKGRGNERMRIKSPKHLSWKSFPYNRSINPGAIIAKRELVPYFDTRYIYSAEVDWQINVLKKANRVEFTGLVLDAFTEETLPKLVAKDLIVERYAVVRKYYGVFRSLINQTIALKGFLINYLKYGRFIVN